MITFNDYMSIKDESLTESQEAQLDDAIALFLAEGYDATDLDREMLEEGTTIVIVSHNLSLIENLCKRVILLDKGQIIKEGKPDQVIPFYEKVIFDRTEEEFKGTLDESSERVQVKDKKSTVDIAKVDNINNEFDDVFEF